MTKNKFRIHAMLRTSTPLHISSGLEGFFNPTTGFATTNKSAPNSSVPCNLVQQMTYVAPGTEFGQASVPVIMANNIMGRLRRRAAGHVFEVLKAKGEQILPTTYSALMCGAASGNPDSEEPSFDQLREATEHPYLGLFGGGPKLYRRNVHGFNAVPHTSISKIAFANIRHPFFDETIHAVPAAMERNLTRTVIVNRNDDLRELVDLEGASKVIGDFEDKIRERQAAIFTGKTSGDSARVSTRSFTGLQYVIPNVVFPLCFELDVTTAQLGLFLLALEDFSTREELGGYGRNGFGRFVLNDVVTTDLDDNLMAEGLFSYGKLDRTHADVQTAITAWEQASQAFTANKLDDLFKPASKAVAAAKGKQAA